jgi:uncharacterized protein
MTVRAKFNNDKLFRLCKENKLKKLSFFGSVLRSDFDEQSDIDILVEFESFDATPDLVGYIQLIEKLSEVFDGRKIDVVTPNSLQGDFKQEVLESAEVVYESK